MNIIGNIDPSKSIRELSDKWTIWRLRTKIKKIMDIQEQSFANKQVMQQAYAEQKNAGLDTSRIISEMFALDYETNRILEKRY